MSVKSKLLLVLSVILLATFLTTSLINYSLTRDAVREELLTSSLPLTGKNIYSEIHTAMMRPLMVSSSMANDAFLKNWIKDGEKDSTAITQYLADIQKEYGFLTTFFVSAITDKYYYQKGLQKRINPRAAHDVWFYAFTRSKEKYDFIVDTNETANHKLTIFINFRVEDKSGRLLGVAGVGVNMDKAIGLLEKTQKEYGRKVYLVDQDGLVQVHLEEQLIRQRYITEAKGISDIANGILQKHEVPVNFEYDVGGQHILLSTRYIPEFQWHLIVEQVEAHALITARNNLIRTLLIGLAASILIIMVCVLVVNYYQSRIENMAKTDPLTGAANRRALQEQFELKAYRSDRYDEPFSIIILDLDEFKPINDTYGHIEGDKILKAVAQVLKPVIRPSDLLVRWGGDEFLVLLDGTSTDAATLAGRACQAIKSCSDIPTSVSCGSAEYVPREDLDTLTRRADEAMYAAKAKGGGFATQG
jgi:diguanylate cyclase (GGDEF)-like protein